MPCREERATDDLLSFSQNLRLNHIVSLKGSCLQVSSSFFAAVCVKRCITVLQSNPGQWTRPTRQRNSQDRACKLRWWRAKWLECSFKSSCVIYHHSLCNDGRWKQYFNQDWYWNDLLVFLEVNQGLTHVSSTLQGGGKGVCVTILLL